MEASDAATSRSSAKRVATVVSKFDKLKRSLVVEIGFGGMLHVPQNNKVCRKFTVWLLSKLNFERRAIVLNQFLSIPLRDVDMERILGIPRGGRKLIGLDVRDSQDKLDFIRFAVGSASTDPEEASALKAAEDVVTMEYPDGMSFEQSERFKVSFVVFVVGHFLIGKAKHNHGLQDFWGSLLVTSDIKHYNFCSMVVDELFESAKRVQTELNANRAVKNITGCSLGLQVFYVESFNVVVRPSIGKDKPAMCLYDCETMNKMVKLIQEKHQSEFNKEESMPGNNKIVNLKPAIEAFLTPPCDRANPHSTCVSENSSAGFVKEVMTISDGKMMPNVEFRRNQPAVSTYLTAYLHQGGEKKLTYSQIDDLKWHNARMTLHIRKTKSMLLEGSDLGGSIASAVEVHMEALMAKVFQDNLCLAQRLHSHQACIDPDKSFSLQASSSLKRSATDSESACGIPSSGSSRRLKHAHGYSNTSNPCSSKSNGGSSSYGCLSWNTPILGKKLFNESPVCPSIIVKKEKGMANKDNVSESKAPPAFVMLRENINDAATNKAIDYSKTTGPLIKKVKCQQGLMSTNPWMFGTIRQRSPDILYRNMYEWLMNHDSPSIIRNWVMHSTPRYIEISGKHLKDIFVKHRPFSRDVFDVAVRRYNQVDRSMYGDGMKKCWRKTFESDFSEIAIEGRYDDIPVSLIDQITMTHLEYDISETRMLIIPALNGLTWCCYFWDMQELLVHIIDPTYEKSNHDELQTIHHANVEKIKLCLSKCIEQLFEGWNVDLGAFKNVFVRPICHCKTGYWSGLLTLIALREFDGSKFNNVHTKATVNDAAKEILYDVLSIEDNYGKLPAGYIQCIDE